MSDTTTLAVLYAAKSTADTKAVSIESQTKACREHAERNGWTVVAEHSDEAKSAYSGSRGPGLAAAKAQAAELAAEHEHDHDTECVLLVFATDRLARGDGRKAAHLVEHVLDATKGGYRVEAVTENLGGEMALLLATLYGERAHADSKAKSAHTKRGIRRRFEAGHYFGSIAPFGYRWEHDKNDKNDPGSLVPGDMAPILRRIFAEYLAGAGDKAIAANLNDDAIPSGRGRRWCGSAVKQILTNPVYVGKLVRRDRPEDRLGNRPRGGAWPIAEVLDGRHEPLIDVETFERAQDLRAARNGGRGRPLTGTHLCVGGLLRCGECGASMRPRTGRNGRSDAYLCRGRDDARNGCSMSRISREPVDESLLAYFRYINVIDVEATVARITAGHVQRAEEADALLADAERQEAEARAELDRLDRHYLAGRIAPETHERMYGDARDAAAACAAAFERLRARREALDDAPIAAGAAALEQVTKLREAVSEWVGSAESIDALRAVLAQTFDRIELHRIDGETLLVPRLRAEAVARVLPVGIELELREEGSDIGVRYGAVPKRVALAPGATKDSALSRSALCRTDAATTEDSAPT
jgi:DNA invertase Pin-like site-specific DNA recombinase